MAAAIVAAVSASTAAAALEPGTPVAVGAGVPGHGRAWELVTPPDTTTGRPINAFVPSSPGVSPSGDRILVRALGALPGAPAGTLVTNNLAERGAGGWTTTSLGYPARENLDAPASLFHGPRAFSPDLTTALWSNPQPAELGGVDLYRSQPAGGYALVANMGLDGFFVDSSEDLQRVVFSSSSHLLPSDAGRVERSSVYAVAGSALAQVDLDSAGALLSECGSSVPEREDAVSSDGGRVFLVGSGPACARPGRIYLREGTTTTEITASHCTRPDCNAEQEATFVGATPSGSSAFFVSGQQLTDDDDDSIVDLYRYDVGSGSLSRLSDSIASPDSFATAMGAMQVSADGSRVYFHFYGPLLPDFPEEEIPAIYLADERGLHFVAPETGEGSFQISGDGRYAVFATRAALDQGDTDEGALDVYRYDAVDGTIEWLSDGPSDASDGLPQNAALTASTEDGGRVFFSTVLQLLPEDRNEAADLYEWAGGRLGLVSSGTGDFPATYVAHSADGRTVFFLTNATLLPRDRDGGDADFYAARIGGGFPEPAPPGGCEGEACRGAPGTRADRPAPRSATFHRGSIDLARIGPAARRRIVATGRIGLLLEVPAPGRVSASARARIEGRLWTVAAGSAEAEEAGPVRLRLPLSAAARRSLAAGADLRVRLVMRHSQLGPVRTASFTLKGAS